MQLQSVRFGMPVECERPRFAKASRKQRPFIPFHFQTHWLKIPWAGAILFQEFFQRMIPLCPAQVGKHIKIGQLCIVESCRVNPFFLTFGGDWQTVLLSDFAAEIRRQFLPRCRDFAPLVDGIHAQPMATCLRLTKSPMQMTKYRWS